MSFGDISARLKKKREEQAPVPSVPAERNYEEIHALRARVLGVLLRDARLASGNTQAEVAKELGVSEDQVRDWEFGRDAPSLPQLEMIAYFLGVPVSHFWGTKTLSAGQEARDVPVPQGDYSELRDRIIGVLLTVARKDSKYSQEELAKVAGLSVETVRAYELGQKAIPFPELTSLATVLRKPMSYFLEDTSRLGSWLALQEEYQRFAELPEEVRAFVVQQTNLPFIEVAMRLSGMPLKELRTVAEKILDITWG